MCIVCTTRSSAMAPLANFRLQHAKKNFIFKLTKEHCCPNKLQFNNKNSSKVFNKNYVQEEEKKSVKQ